MMFREFTRPLRRNRCNVVIAAPDRVRDDSLETPDLIRGRHDSVSLCARHDL